MHLVARTACVAVELSDDRSVFWSAAFRPQKRAWTTGFRTRFSCPACCGVKGGVAHGQTDELGAAAVEDKVHIHDLHATILHLLGFDHEKLTFRHNGRDFRLTDVYGNVVRNVVA